MIILSRVKADLCPLPLTIPVSLLVESCCQVSVCFSPAPFSTVSSSTTWVHCGEFLIHRAGWPMQPGGNWWHDYEKYVITLIKRGEDNRSRHPSIIIGGGGQSQSFGDQQVGAFIHTCSLTSAGILYRLQASWSPALFSGFLAPLAGGGGSCGSVKSVSESGSKDLSPSMYWGNVVANSQVAVQELALASPWWSMVTMSANSRIKIAGKEMKSK
jgi:hypothetical protein